MRPRLRPLGAALALAVLLPLGGCGGSSIDDYCADLRSHQKEMADMIDSSSSSALLGHLPMLHDLADKAPKDLVDEWQTFVGALDDLEKALKDAGVKPSDFEDGKPPAGLSASDRTAIVAAADQVASEDVAQAASGIEQQGRDVCKVNLGVG
jgi:hypothetical protein